MQGTPFQRVRSDLQLIPQEGGALVYDPLVHCYCKLDTVGAAVFRAWRETSVTDIATLTAAASNVSGCALSTASVELVLAFAKQQGWLQPEPEGWRTLAATAEKNTERGWRWVLHNYISLRVPLLRPETTLDRLEPLLTPLFSRGTAILLAVVGTIMVFLASRQWTELSTAVRGLLDASAILGLGVTILVVKFWHEIGHGHIARRYGCSVPSAGVLFVLGAPLFYTDVTDAWRLPNRNKRMMIAAAGLMAEAMLVVPALTLWVFLPDGALRTTAFFVASGSLITSLFVNMSPFMRFDGYFLLSDGVGIPNLHAKSLDAMTWYLRRWVLGFKDAVPALVADLRYGWLALFGMGTLLYRLMLYLGLALIVYHAFFKVAGVVLFAIEIAWFVIKPISNELNIWRQRRREIAWCGQGAVSAVGAVTILVLLFVPLSQSVSMKAVIEAGSMARLHVSAPSVVEMVHRRQGERVVAGDIVLTLSSPTLSHQLRLVETRLALVQARMARAAGDASERNQLPVLQEEEKSLRVQRNGLQTEIDALTIFSPLAGVIAELDPAIHVGRSVSSKDRLALITSNHGIAARAYAGTEQTARLVESSRAVFVPENAVGMRVDLSLARVGAASSHVIEPAALSALYGGDIVTTPDRNGRAVAASSAFLLTFTGDGEPPQLAARGTIHVDALPESFAAKALRRAASIIIRESGV
jgi:putative peptide zinc metalloprotease protein